MALVRQPPMPFGWLLIERPERFSGRALTQGVVNARIDGVPVRVYSAAKTIADCFKYQRKIGIEMAIWAFRTGRPLWVVGHQDQLLTRQVLYATRA